MSVREKPSPYDAVLLLSFGGPEKPEDVMPFLRNVVRGRPVPDARLEKVAEHYLHFDGKSPINDQNRELIAALEKELSSAGHQLPVYWGNRNWHPMLEDTLRQMRDDGVRRAAAFVTSAFSSFSGCKQYRRNIADARAAVGEGAPEIDKLRLYYNHPGFIEPQAELLRQTIAQARAAGAETPHVAFTAHSIPHAMAEACHYLPQLQEACGLVASRAEAPSWSLVFQSRSGPPQVPWLEPDICDYIESEAKHGMKSLVVCPIGFISDHMEVMWDLDNEAKEVAEKAGVAMFRAPTVGVHPQFVVMIRELIEERVGSIPRRALGTLGPWPDTCQGPTCCDYASGRPAAPPRPT